MREVIFAADAIAVGRSLRCRCISFPLLTNVHTDFNRRAAPFACGRAVDHDARRPKTVGHAPTATALPPVVVAAAAAAVGAVATAAGWFRDDLW